MKSGTSYDAVPYATYALQEAHPTRLCAIARLYGVDAAIPSRARVLEIGCGNGGNLIPLAERYPESSFVGIDISEAHIEVAERLARGVDRNNVRFERTDIRDFTPLNGEFDYVICHGVYSWIAPDLQEQLLALISRALASNGVAYVSYNVLPGWRQKGVLRDIISAGAAFTSSLTGVDSPAKRLEGGLELLNVVAKARRGEGDLYGAYANAAVERLQTSERAYLFHEFLEEHNEAILFSEFVERIARHKLHFISEAKPSPMLGEDLGTEAAQYLERFGTNLIAREQCLDILRNRAFRQSVICLESNELARDMRASVLRSLFFSSEFRREGTESTGAVRYRDALVGREISLPADEHAVVLDSVTGGRFRSLSFQELVERVNEASRSAIEERTVMHAIVRLWQAGCLEVMSEASPAARVMPSEVRVSRFALYQNRHDRFVTSLLHRTVELSDSERSFLTALDEGRSFENARADLSARLGSSESDDVIERLLRLGLFAGVSAA